MSISELVCRICLGNISFSRHNIEEKQLQQIYEKLTNYEFNRDSRLPKTICSICHSILKRLGNFSDIACRSERVLMDLLTSGVDKITSNTCAELKTELSSLSIVPAQTISICDEFSTECAENHLSLPNLSNRQVIKMYIPVTVKIELNIKDEDFVKAEKTDNEDSDDHSSVKSENNTNPLCCDTCSKTFANIHLLKSHLISHSEEKPHTCSKCNKAFSRKYNMLKHKKTCKNKKQIKSEAEQDTELYFDCETCSKKFTSKALLKSHRVIHSGEKPYSCEGCSKAFARKQGMKQHMLICSEVKPVPTFSCKYCTQTFDCEGDLNAHISTHPKDKPYTCEKCHRSYTLKENLKQHSKKCLLENELATCTLCPQTFNCRSDLCKHLNVDHDSQKPFCCDGCSAKFWYKNHLKVHMRKHTGEKPYTCEVCGRTFRLPNNLKAHLGTHSGLKPHACEVCGKAYLSRFNLVEHMRRHTGERPYACSVCGKRFGFQSTLRQHLQRVHAQAKPFACDKCPLSFALASRLETHARVHTAARPYACSLCDKTFIEARGLKGHMQVHSDERPHVCAACGKAYKRTEQLRLHIKSRCKAGFALSISS